MRTSTYSIIICTVVLLCLHAAVHTTYIFIVLSYYPMVLVVPVVPVWYWCVPAGTGNVPTSTDSFYYYCSRTSLHSKGGDIYLKRFILTATRQNPPHFLIKSKMPINKEKEQLYFQITTYNYKQ